jgi:hypothetical protein
MARRLRFVPPEGALVEVTCRTIQSRFLLTPSAELNEIILGVLGRAQRLYCAATISPVQRRQLLLCNPCKSLALAGGHRQGPQSQALHRGGAGRNWSRMHK